MTTNTSNNKVIRGLTYDDDDDTSSKKGFWSKIDHISIFFFIANIGQENVFYDILERKNAFLGNKNKKFKKSKN